MPSRVMCRAMPRTRTDDVLAASEIQHAHDPERAEMIARVRRFKASWCELGQSLTELRRHVLDEGTPLPKISRIYREAVFPLDPEEQNEKRLTNLSSTINRLVELLALARADRIVPEQLCAEVEEPLARLSDHLGR